MSSGYHRRPVLFEPRNGNASFLLKEVVAGIEFHWERRKTSVSRPLVLILKQHGPCRQRPSVEDYLISDRFRDECHQFLEYLKAHAVISRSWLLSQIEKREALAHDHRSLSSEVRNEKEWIKWWDREDHLVPRLQMTIVMIPGHHPVSDHSAM